jgi:glutathione peroxidase
MAKVFLAFFLLVGVAATQAFGSNAVSAYDFSFKTIDGEPMPLNQYRGKVMLVVNTASFCGFTPQYEGLEAVYRKFRDQGLVVVGVPANNFGEQEPGSNTEIKKFCTSKFDVDFPMTGKEDVIGGEAHPFYKWVVGELGEGAAPKWNFHKYLIGKDGQVAGVFPSQVKPDAHELTQAIETALAK